MDNLPKRKQLRLKNYDYSQNGCYFVTICTKDRQRLFYSVGADVPVRPIKNKNVGADVSVRPIAETTKIPIINLSPIGKIVDKCWNDINKIYPNVRTDYYVIMPDHFHGIIIIKDDFTGGQCRLLTGGQRRPPLQKIMQGFKSITTRMCFEYGYNQIWQRGYYEHIIRNETDYIQTVEYILNNPLKRK